jgi:hypothetical protein
MDQARKGRRPYSISVGQRPMKSGQTISARLKALKQFFSGFRPCRAGLVWCMFPFHRALTDANAKRLSALSMVTSCLFFIPKCFLWLLSVIKISQNFHPTVK